MSAIMCSMASTMMLSFAYAQYGDVPDIPQMKEVSGDYTNAATGVSITFPAKWSGIEMETAQGTMVTVAPGGMSSGQPTQVMNLMISDKTKVKEAPTDPSQGKSECDTASSSSVTISKAVATEIVVTCTDDYGNITKAAIVSSQTEEQWISAMFISPVEKFDDSIGLFHDALKTMDIPNVIPTTEPVVAELKPSTLKVVVDGDEVDVPVKSSSEVSHLILDEEKKMVSFSVDGSSDGTTLFGIGSILKGPYAVMIDGEQAKDYLMEDEMTMKFSLLAGSHEISVSGAQVIPEFPAAIVGLIVGIVGMVAVIGRTKLFAKLKY